MVRSMRVGQSYDRLPRPFSRGEGRGEGILPFFNDASFGLECSCGGKAAATSGAVSECARFLEYIHIMLSDVLVQGAVP